MVKLKALFMVAAIVSLVHSNSALAADSDDETVVKAGDSAPVFDATTTDGASFSLSGMHGHVVLLDFFATW